MKKPAWEDRKAPIIRSGRTALTLGLAVILVLSASCRKTRDIVDVILEDEKSFFHLDVQRYPRNESSLPIGVFDSGTGGLAVLNEIVEFDRFDNSARIFLEGGDGRPDFEEESFIYLADLANMPYGSYALERNTELLVEHVIKDVQFLLGTRYYQTASSPVSMEDKLPVKAIVVACNTATAYGMEAVRNFLKRAGIGMQVIGVIDAGARGVLDRFAAVEDGSIVVLATAGTVESGAYVRAVESWKKELGRRGDIAVFQQAGIGIAEAVDEIREFIDRDAMAPREGYRGPSETGTGELRIDLSLWRRYGFDMEGNAMLHDGEKESPRDLQINSVENYIAFHLVSLMEKIRSAEGAKPLKAVILGCTHYPFFEAAFREELRRLRDYKEDGRFIYRAFMAEDIKLVDPAVIMAGDLYDFLTGRELYNGSDPGKSEFYVSVPNVLNKRVRIGSDGAFTYAYKYGRRAGENQEYVKRVPFSRRTIPPDILERLSRQIPAVFDLMFRFNRDSQKTAFLEEEERIGVTR